MEVAECGKCSSELFKTIPIDNAQTRAIVAGTELPLECDETGDFYRCPRCGDKNRLQDKGRATHLPAFIMSNM